jgi:hypothetical protein
MTIKNDAYVLGNSPTDTNNFLLDTDGAGALRIRRKSDGSGGVLATINANGTLVMATPQSMVRVNGANGYGSTNTAIRRFTTVATNQGADITYADSATLGATFTINTAGIYAIAYNEQFGGAASFGITLNDSNLTSSVGSSTAAAVLSGSATSSAGAPSCCAWTGYLPSGSVIRANGGASSTGVNTMFNQFTISRVG